MRTFTLWAVIAGCAPRPQEVDTADSAPGASVDPFAAVAPDPDALTDVGTLEAVLEQGTLAGSCDAWRADPSDRAAEVRCGKEMFFTETFDTAGVPRPLVEFLVDAFPGHIGRGFSALGMIPDPATGGRFPIGMSPSAPMGTVETMAYTCASCHFARLPDGRYAVGAPNHDFDYGRQNLAIAVLPMAMAPGADPSTIDPDARAEIQPLIDVLSSNTALRIAFMVNLLPLLGVDAPAFTPAAQRAYAHWEPGTMDFFIQPLPVDDGVHTISRIPPLWEIPSDAEEDAAGMPHAMLGWTGNTRSLEHFLRGFVTTGDGSGWTDADLRPLATYIRTLRRPEPAVGDAAAVGRGEAVFAAQGCLDCHAGPRGSGTRVYAFSEIGTDAELAKWLDPDLDGQPCCGVDTSEDPLTNGVKSPRLVGLWAEQRFLHNGSVPSLDALLCLDGDRPTVTAPAYSDAGHTFGCDATEADRRDLLAYLLAH